MPIDYDRLQQSLTEKLSRYDFEYVGGEFIVNQGKQSVWRLYIDTLQGGITIGQLGEASKLIVDELRLNGVDTQTIQLEISSPGLDRILFTLAQCEKFVGKKVKVKLKQPFNGQRKYQGLLGAVSAADTITVNTAEGENVVIPWWVVAQIRLVPEMNDFKKVKKT